MMSAEFQTTLKRSIGMSGIGLHTGEQGELLLHPAAADSGVIFVTSRGEIPAIADNVFDTRRGTSLRNGDAEIHTVEHVLSALYGMHVDNAYVELKGPEIPIGDGSALPFVEIIENAGIEQLGCEGSFVRLASGVEVVQGTSRLNANPADDLTLHVEISFAHPLIGDQSFVFSLNRAAFKRDIAPARTFCTSDEIDAIRAQGLGKGGREDNVIVVYSDYYSPALRFPDELVRHKVLDLIGDLALVGSRLHADITAVRPSHTVNTSLAKRITQTVKGGM